MRKSLFIAISFLLSAVCFSTALKGAVANDPCDQLTSEATFDVRESILDIASAKVGIAELTGNNDGPEVLEFQKATGNKSGDQWCASFVAWCYKQAGIQSTGNAYSPTWFTTATTIYKPAANINHDPSPGDVFGVWVESKGRVGHVGLIAEWGDEWVTTIEGNYSNKVVKQKRIKRQIYVAADWVSNQSTI